MESGGGGLHLESWRSRPRSVTSTWLGKRLGSCQRPGNNYSEIGGFVSIGLRIFGEHLH
jgi:hypothetical protein